MLCQMEMKLEVLIQEVKNIKQDPKMDKSFKQAEYFCILRKREEVYFFISLDYTFILYLFYIYL